MNGEVIEATNIICGHGKEKGDKTMRLTLLLCILLRYTFTYEWNAQYHLQDTITIEADNVFSATADFHERLPNAQIISVEVDE